MTSELIRVLIWAKTYPELSQHHLETVCTAGVREDGTPVRLYPVPLRYMGIHQQYKLYDWVEVEVARNHKDTRPESRKLVGESLRVLSHVDTDRHGWRARRDPVFRNPSWHYPSIGALKSAENADRTSLGLVTPGSIDDVRLKPRTLKDRSDHETRLNSLSAQKDLFGRKFKELEFLEYEVVLHWRCLERCAECRARPHVMKVLDWGLMQLARKDGWEAAKSRLAKISDLKTHEFRLFMGNFAQHPKTFGIIGLWYPQRPAQLSLL